MTTTSTSAAATSYLLRRAAIYSVITIGSGMLFALVYVTVGAIRAYPLAVAQITFYLFVILATGYAEFRFKRSGFAASSKLSFSLLVLFVTYVLSRYCRIEPQLFLAAGYMILATGLYFSTEKYLDRPSAMNKHYRSARYFITRLVPPVRYWLVPTFAAGLICLILLMMKAPDIAPLVYYMPRLN